MLRLRLICVVFGMPSPPPSPPKYPPPERPTHYRSLGESCRELGLDSHGMRCPACPLKVLCMTETRWRVQRETRPGYMV